MRPKAVVLLLGAALATACADRRTPARAEAEGPPVRGGTLEIVGLSDVNHLATTSGTTANAAWLIRTFARQLVAYPPSADYASATQPAADLAREVPTKTNGGISADGLTYTFHLRRGVRWNSSPPREVTAHDVVRAFKLFCNPVNPVGAKGYYTSTIAGLARYCARFDSVPGTVSAIRAFVNERDIEGVHVLDDSTVVFRLQAPASDFLNILALPFASPVPADYLDYLPDSPEFRRHTLSNGPYRIVRYVQDQEILLARNPVWDTHADPIRPAYVDRIRVRLGMDGQLQQLQIEAGTADLSFCEWAPPAALASLLAIDDPAVWLSPPGGAYGNFSYLALNHVGPNNTGALKRLGVRRAVALAVDKAALVQLFGGPRVARPLNQAVISSAAGYRQGADRYVTPGDRGDPVAARTLLAQAGYPAGISVRLAYPIFPVFSLAAQALQASLKRAGIDVQLLPFTGADLWGRLLPNPENARRGEWDLALSNWLPDWFGESNGRSVIEPLFDGRNFGQNTQNPGGFENPAVDAAIDRALSALMPTAAEKAWSEAARRVMDDVAIVPLIETKNPFVHSRRVRNCTWAVFGGSCDLTSVWLADAARQPGVSR